jgi:hypothetical protein
MRDTANNNSCCAGILKEIRVLEDQLKSISATIEQETNIHDQLRLKSNKESEITMLEKQVAQLYEELTDLLRITAI